MFWFLFYLKYSNLFIYLLVSLSQKDKNQLQNTDPYHSSILNKSSYKIINDPTQFLYDYLELNAMQECILVCLHVKRIEGSLVLFQEPLDLQTAMAQEMVSLPLVQADKHTCNLISTLAVLDFVGQLLTGQYCGSFCVWTLSYVCIFDCFYMSSWVICGLAALNCPLRNKQSILNLNLFVAPTRGKWSSQSWFPGSNYIKDYYS